ncbi:hypothetical protein N7450_011626 [Penicillium hetheringtonii]|uniref:Uncharacterized protein n=1 Tax=Penicillium hetheringtonii TaxID=911720 RepID=A0AAD6DAE4_9EURO|nr:hypothetical protein N7450_011626 [Penicillium hetheringtonii]
MRFPVHESESVQTLSLSLHESTRLYRKEARLAAERRLTYFGAAKISIGQIQFEPPLPRGLDPKNLDRLRGIFRKNRCRRLDVHNHVPATVSRHDLSEALQKANLSQQSLLPADGRHPPRLEFQTGQLWGLHGRHRVQAGMEVFLRRIAGGRLISTRTELQSALVEEYSNERKPTDGELYSKIRQYEGEGNEAFRERWFSGLYQLDNKRNRRLRCAFDGLLTIPGLWPGGMRISVLHRLVASGCVERSGDSKLPRSHSGRVDLFGGIGPAFDEANRPRDRRRPTIVGTRQIAVRCKDCMWAGHERPCVRRIQRGRAASHMCPDENVDGLIPSLYTFFEDFKYLESCVHCLKRLSGPLTRSVWETMSSLFDPNSAAGEDRERGQCLIQTSESTFRRLRATEADCLDLGYQQLWLYAMRHYPLMPPDPRSKDDLLAKPTGVKADPRVIYDMARLARKLGFQSPEIDGLLDDSPDHQIARSALLQARKPGQYRYDDQQFGFLVQRVATCFAEAVPDQPNLSQGLLADNTTKAHARSGIPRTRTHTQDAPFLFLDRLYAGVESADTITSFFVRRCVYFAFFGKSANLRNATATEAGDASISQGVDGEERVERRSSMLFVERDGSSASHEPRQQTIPPSLPPDRAGSEIVIRQHDSHQPIHSDDGIEPMDLDPPSPESDYVILGRLDQSSPDDPAPKKPEAQSNQSNSVLEMVSCCRSPTMAPEIGDAMSEGTQTSLETVQLGWSQDELGTGRSQEREPDTASERDVDVPTQQPSLSDRGSVSEIRRSTGPEELEAFLAGLRRAQEEQEQLEKRMAMERLDDELNRLHHQSSPPAEEWFSPGNMRGVSYSTLCDQPVEAIHKGTEHTPTQSDRTNTRPQPPMHDESDCPLTQHVEIRFWSLERGEWNQSDCLLIDRSDPSPVERVARKYSCKGYSLYDVHLHSIRPGHCYRAASVDGSNAIFVISAHEEDQLAGAGGLGQVKQLVSMASKAVAGTMGR